MNSEGRESEVSKLEVPETEEIIENSSNVADANADVNSDLDAGADSEEEVMLLAEASDPDLVLPVWEATGNHEVDQALEMIQTLDSENVHQHPEVLGEVHAQLHGLMSQLDR